MTQQTSEQRQGEAKDTVFNDALYMRLMGIDKTREGSCETHGKYTDAHCSGNGKVPEGWRGCPECEREQWEAESAERSRQEQIKRQAQRIEQLVQSSGIPLRFAGKSFEDYEAVTPKAENHLRKVREYADMVCGEDHGGRCLLMLGKVGNGKTHLGCALIEQVIRRTSNPAYYWTFSELVRAVKASFSKGAEQSEQEVYRDFACGRVVVLDEVGMQNFTDFEQAVAYEAINARYLAEKPTVLISNLQAKDLPLCIGERVVDRLREGGGKALDFDWKSYRSGGAA